MNKLIVNDKDTKKIIMEKLLNVKTIDNQNITKYLIQIFNNFYINNDDFSFYLRRLNSCIYFIYNIIKKNADQKGIVVNDLFLA